MKKLDLTKLVAEEPRRLEIDVSAAFGEPAGETVLVLQEPDAAQIFQARALIPKIKKANPEWTNELCGTVAQFAISHIAPDVENDPIALYSAIANQNAQLFFTLDARFKRAFPDRLDFGGAVADAKNG